MIHNVVIIGSGPAGLTAGIYTARSGLNPILFEGNLPGGQLTWTTKVENWPAEQSILGPNLMQNMREHAIASGCKLIQKTITKIDLSKSPYKITINNSSEETLSSETFNVEEIQTKSIIIATGAIHRRLGIEGEDKYWGNGVSVCSVCDGPFYQDKELVVVGGGNSAMTECYHLAKFAKKITLIHISDKLSANDPIKDEIINNPKIEIFYNSEIKKINGDSNHVTDIDVKNKLTNKTSNLKVSGVFVSIGLIPNSSLVKDQLELDDRGYIIRKDGTQTSKTGVFTAGDVSDYKYRQAITAAGQGCMAAIDCYNFLNQK